MTSESSNLTAKVYSCLKNDILSGKYEKGTALTENAVAQELNVSRTPVREALRQLELGELVRIVPNKGAIVEGISIDDIRSIYEIRSLIEGIAAVHAVNNATDDEIEQLSEIVDLTEFYLERGDSVKLRDMDGRFHQCLYRISKNRMLEHVLNELHGYGVRFRDKSMQSKGRVEKTIVEHRDIMHAIKDRNAEKAKQLATLHINNALQNILITHSKD